MPHARLALNIHRFAEPERVLMTSTKAIYLTELTEQCQKYPSSNPSASTPPAPIPVHNQAQQAIHAQQYANKPPPPLPRQEADNRRPSPQMQPPANYNYGSSPPQSNFMAPPPLNYGQSRPPPVQNRPAQMSRPPPSPAPPNGADPALWPLFKAVDKDGNSTYKPHCRYFANDPL